jgi:hypothetical protein
MRVHLAAAGYAKDMEGGIAFILLLLIVVVGGVVGIALYLTGGALWFGKTHPEGDKIEGSDAGSAKRPRFKRVDVPEEEHVMLAATEGGERENREASRRAHDDG